MEEAALASIACSLFNQYTMLANNIKYMATLCSFFSRIRYTNLARQVGVGGGGGVAGDFVL